MASPCRKLASWCLCRTRMVKLWTWSSRWAASRTPAPTELPLPCPTSPTSLASVSQAITSPRPPRSEDANGMKNRPSSLLSCLITCPTVLFPLLRWMTTPFIMIKNMIFVLGVTYTYINKGCVYNLPEKLILFNILITSHFYSYKYVKKFLIIEKKNQLKMLGE